MLNSDGSYTVTKEGATIGTGFYNIDSAGTVTLILGDSTRRIWEQDGSVSVVDASGAKTSNNPACMTTLTCVPVAAASTYNSAPTSTSVTNSDGSVTTTWSDGVIVVMGTDGIETTQYPAGG